MPLISAFGKRGKRLTTSLGFFFHLFICLFVCLLTFVWQWVYVCAGATMFMWRFGHCGSWFSPVRLGCKQLYPLNDYTGLDLWFYFYDRILLCHSEWPRTPECQD